MPVALLPDRALVTVTGPDATALLQGVLTCNVETLQDAEARLGALLTPQGKILFDFLVSRLPDGFRFDVQVDRAADLAKRLTLYRLRAKATIAADPTVAVAVAWDGAVPPAAEAVADSRHPDLGARLYAEEGAFSADAAEADYHAHRIALGIPEGGRDYAFGDAFPHEALMDQLGGVDFRKGCYVGQEVVSRMQHRGTARTRILAATYPDGAPAPGTEITAGGKVLGTTGSVAGQRGLALVRIDRLGDALAAGETPRAGEHPVQLERPGYATFVMPEGAASAAG
ncbi:MULTISPECIES: CAF17-like 4Fe-4S cluster assembly/insertion protein YgfZ [unclassified Methylobacterium]|jgi:folate-binding protein YgfZ|uniref:CAF17-like 4Fe-4S cluster assembly/insertion protein YgfZ n=1 Tax=unclassified Methylobacterium TaxID=2615210 RepID=UPI001353F56A|nr:folate-binding protein YgfZ [Methylobacterium sp. 2A]MWV22521.1 folate-binding protein YgfZ [Methylobacterium sp. 2A]